ncbi:hypothetical protein [Streptomyces sp. NPDC051016]|uniref:hypothetical protein n=1 Tax=Streptomyces sp. NPDC051016 TaxID=3365638 RepID=UPI0037873C7D
MRTSIAHTNIPDRDESAAALRLVSARPEYVPPLDVARDMARTILAEANALDLDVATIGEVYGQRSALQESLRQVLGALDAEDGRHA